MVCWPNPIPERRVTPHLWRMRNPCSSSEHGLFIQPLPESRMTPQLWHLRNPHSSSEHGPLTQSYTWQQDDPTLIAPEKSMLYQQHMVCWSNPIPNSRVTPQLWCPWNHGSSSEHGLLIQSSTVPESSVTPHLWRPRNPRSRSEHR